LLPRPEINTAMRRSSMPVTMLLPDYLSRVPVSAQSDGGVSTHGTGRRLRNHCGAAEALDRPSCPRARQNARGDRRRSELESGRMRRAPVAYRS